jgi:hypothetical protein
MIDYEYLNKINQKINSQWLNVRLCQSVVIEFETPTNQGFIPKCFG